MKPPKIQSGFAAIFYNFKFLWGGKFFYEILDSEIKKEKTPK